ncbi:hypothetical protein G7054_g193 [Neopestalotiopsis clavispora]|nr:hypothetical protein G7054_g193 [Neopestalotiopsis clavispora]
MASAGEEWRGTKAVIKRTFIDPIAPLDSESSGCEDEGDELPSEPFGYDQVLGADRIRLLELRPGKRGDPLIVRLLPPIQLGACAGRYEALSYVWGPSERSTCIQVNERHMEIRRNLCCALTNLRDAKQPRVLWVDALCIDQSSIVERNAQVSIMHQIYSQASRTVCFFGPRRNTTGRLYTMLSELAKEAEAAHPVGSPDDDSDTVPAFINSLMASRIESKLHDKYVWDLSIMAMAGCDWWQRAWTAQELLLSPNAVFMIGTRTIRWDTVCKAVDHGIRARIWEAYSFGFVMDRAIVPYMSMRILMNRRRTRNFDNGSPSRKLFAADLFEQLALIRYRQSSNPRDKVYAVLGFFNSGLSGATDGAGHLGIKLDYHLPVEIIYCETARSIISNMDCLDVLGTSSASTRSELPSWVTDWSDTLDKGSLLTRDSFGRDRLTHSTRNTPAEARYFDDGRTLCLRGHELASVTALTMAFPDNVSGSNSEDSAYFEKNPRWFKMALATPAALHKFFANLTSAYDSIFSWARFCLAEPIKNTHEDPMSVFWQTLCAGTYGKGGLEKTSSVFHSWFERLRPVREFMESHPVIHKHVPEVAFAKLLGATWDSYGEFWPYMACVHHRRMGRTSSGWLCLLPEGAQLGDIIILVCGGRTPLVIRPSNDGYYTLVGEAYIHGAMDGEAFDKARCVDIKIR